MLDIGESFDALILPPHHCAVDGEDAGGETGARERAHTEARLSGPTVFLFGVVDDASVRVGRTLQLTLVIVEFPPRIKLAGVDLAKLHGVASRPRRAVGDADDALGAAGVGHGESQRRTEQVEVAAAAAVADFALVWQTFVNFDGLGDVIRSLEEMRVRAEEGIG